MIAPGAGLSVNRQCALLAVARSSFYHRPRPGCAEELELLERLDLVLIERACNSARLRSRSDSSPMDCCGSTRP